MNKIRNLSRDMDKGELLSELEAFVRLRISLILVPVHKFLTGVSEKRLWRAIYGLTGEVKTDIEEILTRYEIGRKALEDNPTKMALTERQKSLIQCLHDLDENERHIVKVYCRGTEPWEVELLKKHRFSLRP